MELGDAHWIPAGVNDENSFEDVSEVLSQLNMNMYMNDIKIHK